MMKISPRQQAGFTLIELVMVIVILGILAAFALPRFADLSGDARKASMQGLAGTIKSASAIVHAKALVENKTAASGQDVTLEGQTINLAYGYATVADITKAANVDTTNDYTATASGTTSVTITIKGYTPASGNCHVIYTAATAATSPATVSIDTGGC